LTFGPVLTSPVAVIYLKNRVNRAWERSDYYPNDTVIPDDEKARFKERLLPILAGSQNLVRHQLVPILQRILHFDFPERWPNFMDYSLQLLNTNDPRSVLAGLQCLLAVCRAYRFKASDSDSRTHFDKIIEATFPRLLVICNELVNQESDEAGEMLHIALKCYKHATWVGFLWWRRRLRTSRADIGHSSSFANSSAKAKSTSGGAPSSSRLYPRPLPPVPCRASLWSVSVTIGGRRRSGRSST
jgi:hypothetical protein